MRKEPLKPTDLTEHPEGGCFKEVYRSGTVVTAEGLGERSALTHIYFSLERGEVSKFHKVETDEVWNLYRGALVLYLWDEGEGGAVQRVELSAEQETYCHIVPAGVWQAAEPLSDSVLVGCSVGPGFEFQDFTLISPDSPVVEALRAHGWQDECFL